MTDLILYGGKRSPFVRRVELWLALQERAYERRPADIFGAEFEVFRAYNPLSRVPVLVVPDLAPLIETAAIIDFLETTAPPERCLIPAGGDGRVGCQQRIALANSLAEKGVAYVYETERRPAQYQWPEWRYRLASQIRSGIEALEALAPADGWFGGETPDGSDLAAIATFDFLCGIADVLEGLALPSLSALSKRSRSIEIFAATVPVKA